MAADDLVTFLVRGLVDNPDEVVVSTLEGDASLVLEVSVEPSDMELVAGDDGETLRHIKALAAAASGKKKAIVELVSLNGAGEE